MGKNTIIDKIYKENEEIFNYLLENKEISYKSDLENKLKKLLVLSIGSYFEDEFCKLLLEFVKDKSKNELIKEFMDNQALKRKYHTLFDWEARHANKFFGLFGSDFKDKMTHLVNEDDELKEAISAFLLLGQLRNELIHSNLGLKNIDQTETDIYKNYEKALLFLSKFKEVIYKYKGECENQMPI